ncbi:MAG: MOSC N-terminal beta barrel domain-containing protein [Acidobacteriota bacterium]
MKISEINIYPVKSLRGIAVDSAAIEDRGLKLDRRWIIVDAKRKFLTQREFPVMAAIEVAVDGEKLTASHGGSSVTVPFEPDAGDAMNVTVWTSSVKAKPNSVEVNDWLSQILGIECSLFTMTKLSKRIVNPFYAVRKFDDQLSFADGYPFMLIGQASHDDLNSRLDLPVPMNRFRPNFVVSGSEPFAEDTWKRVRIGDNVFHVVKPCERCVMPTIDQSAGVKTGLEPLKTLASFRTKNGKVLFGQNLIAERPGGTISIGDEVEVTEAKQPIA